MTAQAVSQLEAQLCAIKDRRKAATLDDREYYEALLHLLADVVNSLLHEADETATMRLEDVRRQIPLVLVFVEEQIRLYRRREDARQ